MGYIIKKGTGGGGGGDATAANQQTQIAQLLENNGSQSVFKYADQSLFYKTIINNPASVTPNSIQCVDFTSATAAGVTALLNTWLNSNNVAVINLTSSQSIGSHDLFLLYSPI
jgi:hypothetical protein